MNITFGTIGTILSGYYICETGGVGAAAGGTTAMFMCLGQITLGITQIGDVLATGGKTEVLHHVSNPVGLVSKAFGSENYMVWDAFGGMTTGFLTGGRPSNLLGVTNTTYKFVESPSVYNALVAIYSTENLINFLTVTESVTEDIIKLEYELIT